MELRGIPKNLRENLLCEYTCKTCGKKGGDEKKFNGILAMVLKLLSSLLNLIPQFQVKHRILNYSIFSLGFLGIPLKKGRGRR